MKKLYYIIGLFLVFSCMNKAEKSESITYDDAEMDIESLKENKAALLEAETISFTEKDIAFQKLQEFYDLNLLKLHHPEFEEDISKQIAEISNINIDLPKLIREVKISNHKQYEAIEVVNDSVSKLKLIYYVQSSQGTQRDTIVAVIKSKTTLIDGEEQNAYKVKFEKN